MMKKLISVLLALSILFTLSVTVFAAPQKELITEEEAKAIAFEAAGVDAEDVKLLKVRLDYDDGIYEYEVDFRIGSAEEYEYTINAATGKIIDFDYDYDPPRYDYDDKYDGYDDVIEDKVDAWFIRFLTALVEFLRSFIAQNA